ncbi:hypothetical protein C4K03_2461 [Pseudomonas synxantha]|uniref:Uncharacterized protein n=1 Tax=Pseudomonas synxantha TaxID=47883 RepID=A0A3G7U7V2_9PSED|nr:hypothetical protein [Pseudomonas synxantha]AZE54616.1 hypothetical protein C4K03_2461 [Pseudomonas synxantha]
MSTTMLLALAVATHPTCSVPIQLQDMNMINSVDAHYRPDNPHAGNLLHITFGADRYQLRVLNSDVQAEGEYQYRRLARNVGQWEAREAYQGQTSVYRVTLVCLSDTTGTFVYSQSQGAVAPQVRQNTGRYTLRPTGEAPHSPSADVRATPGAPMMPRGDGCEGSAGTHASPTCRLSTLPGTGVAVTRSTAPEIATDPPIKPRPPHDLLFAWR